MTLESKSLRLIIVGVSAALLFFGLNYGFLSAGGQPFISSIVAYGIAFCFAYTAQQRWTFGGQHAHGRAFPRYLAAQLICAVLSGLISQLSAGVLEASPFTVSALSVVIGSAASFLLVRFWVFS